MLTFAFRVVELLNEVFDQHETRPFNPDSSSKDLPLIIKNVSAFIKYIFFTKVVSMLGRGIDEI